jgi:UDP-glucose 4-epimerase
MRVLITGAGGLLGRSLAAAARAAGHETIGLGRSGQAPAGLACDRWIAGDLTDPRILEHDWRPCAGAAVFHLAADTGIYHAGGDALRGSALVTEAACKLAQRTGGRLVFFSSSAVYSGRHTRHPVTALSESDETNPTTIYGRSKRAAEVSLSRSGVETVVLRIFGVLSDRLPAVPDRGNLIQALCRARATGEELTVTVDALGHTAVRDYVLDEDVARCALAALDWPLGGNRCVTVNLCTGEGTSVLSLVELVQSLGGRDLRVRWAPPLTGFNAVMVGDPAELRKRCTPIPANRVREFWTRLLADRAPAS